jgi:hypothetical protein
LIAIIKVITSFGSESGNINAAPRSAETFAIASVNVAGAVLPAI